MPFFGNGLEKIAQDKTSGLIMKINYVTYF